MSGDEKFKLDYDPDTKKCLLTIKLSPTTIITHILSDAEFEREYRAYYMRRKAAKKAPPA